ncbi:hypothetical protein P691DRAFT_780617 [Macrolepiota fuliginosa MF-IS2]|uniref:Uncharacterized protein n=1 Tax=Macrolepiota fuliginosa MF-IS2 TaxID=1400762 RepID=A0A9P5X0G2_9AGAR|nr:hypothetical protein P691DRAFT_780617 [Macrolepiota fuliginosa MF-IS2]
MTPGVAVQWALGGIASVRGLESAETLSNSVYCCWVLLFVEKWKLPLAASLCPTIPPSLASRTDPCTLRHTQRNLRGLLPIMRRWCLVRVIVCSTRRGTKILVSHHVGLVLLRWYHLVHTLNSRINIPRVFNGHHDLATSDHIAHNLEIEM